MNIGRVRLANQHVSRPTLDDPAAVVARLGAVQAQDYLGGLWAVGLRTRDATETTVEKAIARGRIVRTWPMRGTLHFVAAVDVRWMLRLLTPRVVAATTSRRRSLGLDDATLTRAARVAERALTGGTRLRRDALYAVWERAGIATRESRGLHMLSYLSMTGLLCFGPRDGRQQTFVLLEEWVPTAPDLAREEALGALARRYIASHGPATVHDLAWWSGLTVSDARRALEHAGSQLVAETVGGRTLWMSPGTEGTRGGPSVHLLPAWDEFTVAYRDRSDVLDPSHATRVNAGGGVLKPVVVAGQRVAGTWQRTLTRTAVRVRTMPFAPSAVDDRSVARAIARYARFLQRDAGPGDQA